MGWRGGGRRVLITAVAVLFSASCSTSPERDAIDSRPTKAIRSPPTTSTTSGATTPTDTRAPAIPAATSAPPPPIARIAFVGDSLAVNLAEGALKQTAGRTPMVHVANHGISGCGVARSGTYRLGGRELRLSPICARWSDTWAVALARDKPHVVVIQVGRHEVLDRQLDGEWTNVLEPAYASYVRTELDTAVSLASGDDRSVVLVTSPYFRASPSGERPEDDPARVDRFNQLLSEVAAGRDRVYIADLGGRASPNGAYTDVVDGIRIRADGVHYSDAGASWAATWLVPRLLPLVPGISG